MAGGGPVGGVRVRATALRTEVAQQAEPQILPIVFDIQPPDKGTGLSGPVSLIFVIDRSGSMEDDSKIEHVKEAMKLAVQTLRPTDYCSVVVFNQDSQVILGHRLVGDGRAFVSAIDSIEAGGGTRISRGVAKAIQELEFTQSLVGGSTKIILLTDGHTDSDEEECRVLARKSAEARSSIDAFGLGGDWNNALLEEMGSASGGSLTFLNETDDIADYFRATVSKMQSVALSNTRLRLHLVQTTSLVPDSIYRVSPDVLDLRPPGYGGIVDLNLGDIASGDGVTVFCEVQLPAGVQGRFRPVRAEFRYTEAGSTTEKSDTADIILTVNPNVQGEQNARVTAVRASLATVRIEKSIAKDIAAGNTDGATRKLENLTRRLSSSGDAAGAAEATRLLEEVKSSTGGGAPQTVRLAEHSRKTVRLTADTVKLS
ncbi:MAG: VWA domain-containing protein [Actinobacteria bacterium]|nr:VWA domain-containing protein [Actinomycetota bacterium]